MEQKVRKKPFSVAIIVLSVITIFSATLSFFNIDNIWFRVITQVSLALIMLLNGIRSIKFFKQKTVGYANIGIAIFLLFVMVLTFFAY